MARDHGHLVPVGVYPNTQKELDTKAIPRGQTLAPVSPYLDEMMMTNVRQFQIPRFPNDKRFQTKLCAEVVNSVPKLFVGYSERDQPTIPHNHLSEDTLKPRTFSSFLCASS